MERYEDWFPRAVVLVEGVSDQLALEALARRRGRDLGAEGVSIVVIGGSKNIGRFLDLFGPRGADVMLAGLCDAAEVGDYRAALQRAGLGSNLSAADMERLGFFVCDADLEDELFRAAGPAVVEEVFEALGDLAAFRTFQRQPAWRDRPREEQLPRFVGTRSGRKIQTGARLVDAMDPEKIPRPLDLVLAHVGGSPSAGGSSADRGPNRLTESPRSGDAAQVTEQISRKRFHEWDWRVIRDAASAHFRTASFATGVALVEQIGRLADAAGRHPDVDLRPDGVTVRLSNNVGEFSGGDIALAEQISAAARDVGAPVDPSALQFVQVAIDALVIPDVMPFWKAVLGYEQVGDEDLHHPRMEGPPFWFQQMDAPRPQRNRIHIDLYVPHDQAQARVAAGLAAGGHVVSDEHAPGWWTLADAEGNEVDVAPWPDGD